MRLTRKNHLLFNHLSEKSLSEGIIVLLTLECHEVSILIHLGRLIPLEELGDAD